MFTTLLLTTSLAAGQPPAPPPIAYAPRPAVYAPAGQPPAALPMVQVPNGGLPMTQPPPPTTGGVGNSSTLNAANPAVTEYIKDEKEEPPAATKYLFERTIAETRLGEILEQRNIKIYGWTEQSYNASSAAHNNAPVFMYDQANKYQLNQNWLHVERTIDTTKDEFQWGWNMDWILPGTDARTTVVRGLWYNQIRNGYAYPIDPFQFYAQAFLPGLGGKGTSVKIGRFATHMEYELVQAPDTPFISRSYLFQYNPFTHTGIWAVTQLNDTWSVGNGAATGNDTFIDGPTNRLTYLGQLKWAPKEGKTQVLFNTTVTNPTYAQSSNFNFYNVYNIQVIHKFTDKLTYVLDTAYSHENNIPNVGFANWYGAVNYLMYNHTDKLTSTLRAEVFDDQQGVRTGFRGLYTEVTYGVAYKPLPGVIIRPSVRYDNNANSAPWEGKQNLFSTAIDLILRW